MKFSERIKKERLRAGLTQPECADMLGISARLLWQWENDDEKAPLGITQDGALWLLAKKPTKKKGK